MDASIKATEVMDGAGVVEVLGQVQSVRSHTHVTTLKHTVAVISPTKLHVRASHCPLNSASNAHDIEVGPS